MDGHIGEQASQYVKDHYIVTLSNEFKVTSKIKTKNAIINALSKIEADLNEHEKFSGTTLAGVVIRNGKVIMHHIGDSRVIIGLKDGHIVESIDHKPNLYCERYRICVQNKSSLMPYQTPYRLLSQLAMSRSIGHHRTKCQSRDNIATPDFQQILQEEVKWILVATDGVIDQVTTVQIVTIINCLSHKPHKVMKTNSDLENLTIEVFNGEMYVPYFKTVFEDEYPGQQIVSQDGSISKKIVNTLIAISYRSSGYDNISAIFQIIPEFEAYNPRNFNALQVENTDCDIKTFAETFPFPRILAQSADKYLVYDNSTYTQLLIRHKFPQAKILELELNREQLQKITLSYYKFATKYVLLSYIIYVTQSKTKFKYLILSIKKFKARKVKRNKSPDDFTLKFRCFKFTIPYKQNKIYKQFALMEIPSIIHIYTPRIPYYLQYPNHTISYEQQYISLQTYDEEISSTSDIQSLRSTFTEELTKNTVYSQERFLRKLCNINHDIVQQPLDNNTELIQYSNKEELTSEKDQQSIIREANEQSLSHCQSESTVSYHISALIQKPKSNIIEERTTMFQTLRKRIALIYNKLKQKLFGK
ncbi:Protein phosphatase 2C [Spironucleus salmonicida]|uniref:Protein phosphatase 2C n=1 Tax=Spironucleus salmonicida TaxID=348837 RepID=V6LIG2_9EUKA|nr:Protein phosphatase 2C [Spironucleus salmonicida]|eukprot:EST43501.1 Protein phosphatase 2C [Spironucleus salmonicida]